MTAGGYTPRLTSAAREIPAAAPTPLAGRRPIVQRQEMWSFGSHFLAALAAVVGTVVLAVASRDSSLRVVSLVYGGSMVFLFTASSLYHAFKDQEDGGSIWRRLDHLAIFFMIAGSYTPICYVYLTGPWRWSILGVQWGLVVLGLGFKLIFLHAPRVATTAIYLVMGWIAVVPFEQLRDRMDGSSASLLIGGGLAYTVGAICYAAKRPNPAPGWFGFHEIFHLFVILGALLHYLLIYRLVA